MTTPQQIVAEHYQIDSFLSQGGMGAVYRGQDLRTGEVVAVKRVRQDLIVQDAGIVERFIREGEALRLLNHPNIVKLLATAEQDGQHYLVMEYVNGGSLADLLAKEPQLAVDRVLDISLELSDALSRAHHLKIIHRDLKPANILLADDGTPRLTDFGVAYMDGSQITQSDTLLGTHAYLSPDVLNNQVIDARADLWALGVILFEMLAGSRPFEGQVVGATLAAILTQPTPSLEDIRPDAPTALVDLVYRMLEKDRDQRIPSARLVGAELENIIRQRQSDSKQEARQAARSLMGLGALPATDPPRIPNNLPVQTTRFVGRETELADLSRQLADPAARLITILGPGGMGKTRLALEAARTQLNTFPDGVYFVALAPLTSADFIAATIAETVSFQFAPQPGEGGDQKRQLTDFLRDKQMLLILDNFEQILDGAALVSDIIQSAPGIKALVTSRSRLNLDGENLLQLGGMAYPQNVNPDSVLDYDATKLFLQSARRVRPNFAIAPADVVHLARICRQVDGLPLGILLAATWIEVLSLRDIADEIERNVDFLETEHQDVPTRQRTIRAVFNYSWRLLSADEQAVFRRLSAFRTSFTREAAQTVAHASLRSLMGLVNKSMLARSPQGRYTIHELLKRYAFEELQNSGDLDGLKTVYCDYFTAYTEAESANSQSAGTGQAVMDLDYENIRQAMEWSLERQSAEQLLRLSGALVIYWREHGNISEGRHWLNEAIAISDRTDAPPELRAKVLSAAGILAWNQADFDAASRYLEAGAAIKRTLGAPDLAQSLTFLGHIALNKGDFDRARQYYEEVLTLGEKKNDPAMRASALGNLGMMSATMANFDAAVPYFQESLVILKSLGNWERIAVVTCNLGVIYLKRQDYATAIRMFEEALEIQKEIPSKPLAATLLANLAEAYLKIGDYPRSRALHIDSLHIIQELDDRLSLAIILESFACLAIEEGNPDQTALLFGATTAAREALGAPIPPREQENLDIAIGRARDALGEVGFAQLWANGQSLTLEQAAAYASTPPASKR